MFAPVMDELAGEFAGRAKIAKLNTIEHNAVAKKYDALRVPTVWIFHKGQGEIVNRTEQGGVIIDKDYYTDKLNQTLRR
jgi:thioredoxin 1